MEPRESDAAQLHLPKEELFTELYAELRSAAKSLMEDECSSHTLTPTDLVHEVYTRLRDTWEDKRQFQLAAGVAMRHLLVDWARRKMRIKRGGGRAKEEFHEDRLALSLGLSALDVLCLQEALELLRHSKVSQAARKWEVVHLKFFSGLTNEQVAERLEVSLATVERDWKFARAWLHDSIAKMDRDFACEGL